jgi:predicted HAD superfamily phosphohydrolase YqeG
MRVEYRQVDDLGDVVRWLTELGSRTVIFDVEPLIALWDTGEDILREGVDTTITEILAVKDIEVIGFATNSLRHLQIHPDHDGVQAFYISRAVKPFATRRHRRLPRPGALVGDQIATDGLLAWRLGFAFAHVQHSSSRHPWGPRLMYHLGRPLTSRLFQPDQNRPTG